MIQLLILQVFWQERNSINTSRGTLDGVTMGLQFPAVLHCGSSGLGVSTCTAQAYGHQVVPVYIFHGTPWEKHVWPKYKILLLLSMEAPVCRRAKARVSRRGLQWQSGFHCVTGCSGNSWSALNRLRPCVSLVSDQSPPPTLLARCLTSPGQWAELFFLY